MPGVVAHKETKGTWGTSFRKLPTELVNSRSSCGHGSSQSLKAAEIGVVQ
jgi:hypothetical protein